VIDKTKQWWLALGAMSAGLSATPGHAQDRVGVAAAVNETTRGVLPDGQARTLVIANDMFFRETVATDARGQTQILFLDQSALTVGPNSEMVIDEFVYDPAQGAGRLAVSATKGVARFVGGALSKAAGQVRFQTPTATIGLRGGILLFSVDPNTGATEAVFLFGNEMTVTNRSGATVTVQRTGFSVRVDANGTITGPIRLPDSRLDQLFAALEGPGGTSSPAASAINSRVVDTSLFGLPAPTNRAPVVNVQPIEDRLGTQGITQQQLRDVLKNVPPPPPSTLPPSY
jgi:trimeric autotransporter adhesin